MMDVIINTYYYYVFQNEDSKLLRDKQLKQATININIHLYLKVLKKFLKLINSLINDFRLDLFLPFEGAKRKEKKKKKEKNKETRKIRKEQFYDAKISKLFCKNPKRLEQL